MSSSATSPPTTRPLEGWLLVGLVALVVAAELLVSSLPTLGASEPVRVALAALTLVVVPLVGVVGVLRETLHPAVLVVSLPLATLYAYTGLLLPWTQLSFRLGQVGVELALSVPVVGGTIAQLLFAGFTLTQATLERAYLLHRLTLVAAAAAIAVALAWSRSSSARPARGDVHE